MVEQRNNPEFPAFIGTPETIFLGVGAIVEQKFLIEMPLQFNALVHQLKSIHSIYCNDYFIPKLFTVSHTKSCQIKIHSSCQEQRMGTVVKNNDNAPNRADKI